MNAQVTTPSLPSSRILLDHTFATKGFVDLLDKIEGFALKHGLCLDVSLHKKIVTISFGDPCSNEIGVITATLLENHCGCGKTAVIFGTNTDLAWLLWPQ